MHVTTQVFFVFSALLVLSGCHRQQVPRCPYFGGCAALASPACIPNRPAASIAVHEATHATLSSSSARLLAIVGGVNAMRPRFESTSIKFRQHPRSGHIATDSGGLVVLDSLAPGPVVIDVLAIGFDVLHDTVQARAGFIDTLIVRLRPVCI